jgi:hypothetical protein
MTDDKAFQILRDAIDEKEVARGTTATDRERAAQRGIVRPRPSFKVQLDTRLKCMEGNQEIIFDILKDQLKVLEKIVTLTERNTAAVSCRN